jgi:hypothetical protein
MQIGFSKKENAERGRGNQRATERRVKYEKEIPGVLLLALSLTRMGPWISPCSSLSLNFPVRKMESADSSGAASEDTGKGRWSKELKARSEFNLPATEALTCPAAGATAAPDPPGVPSGCRSRYRAQSPTLGRRTRAASTSATACKSRFSFRLIGAGQPRRDPPAPPHRPQLRASARPPVRPSARRRQQKLGEQKRPRRRPRSNSAALPPLAGQGAGRCHYTAATGGGNAAANVALGPGRAAPLTPPSPGSAVESQCLRPRPPPVVPMRRSATRPRVGNPLPRPRWCVPLLRGSPARQSFAKVPELRSWALTGPSWVLVRRVRIGTFECATGPQHPSDDFCCGLQPEVASSLGLRR